MDNILKKVGEKNFLLLLNHLLVLKKKPYFETFEIAIAEILERGVCGILVDEGVAKDYEEAKRIFLEKEKQFSF